MYKKTVSISALLLLSTFILIAAAQQPSAQTPTGSIKAVTWLLKKYHTKKILTKQQLESNKQIKNQLSKLIDLRYMGRLALQDHWKKMSTKKRAQFYALFVPLVEEVAYTLNAKYFSGDKIQVTYQSEKLLKNGYAKVFTTAYQKQNDIRVQTDYLLYKNKKNGKWTMCNLYIDNSSLINDYRNQFNTIVRRWGIKRLFYLMKKKHNDFKKRQKL